MFPRTA